MDGQLKFGVGETEKKIDRNRNARKSLKRKRAVRGYTTYAGEWPSSSKTSNKKQPTMSLIVGIDFGTTYTGVSIVPSTSNPGEVEVLKRWPNSEEELEKVPSVIAYEEDNKNLFSGVKWGYEVTPGMKSYSWFKLRVADDDEPESYDDPLLRQSAGEGLLKLPNGKIADDVCKDYLDCLYDHVQNYLKEEWGESIMNQTQLRFVLTVPAGWSDYIKNKILTAAKEAGFGYCLRDSIRMADEPEAAALYSFATGNGRPIILRNFRKDSNVMIVDMGGGTIDLITYRVDKWSPLRVREAVTGKGAKCGSTTIDRQLHALMERKYGTAFTEKGDKIGIGSRFMRRFEAIKRTFDGTNRAEFSLPLLMDHPDTEDYEAGRQRVVITSAELEIMFEEVHTRLFGLVSDQISLAREENGDHIRTIILCGGLANSPYIVKKLNEFCSIELEGKTRIFVPDNPWSAIARGAALRALRPRSTIESRKCRRSYGVSVHRKFVPGQDNERLAYHCPINGKRLDGVMKWHIRKGEKMESQKLNWIDGYVVLNSGRTDSSRYSGTLPIYYCDLDDPPETVSDQGVRKLGELKLDFSGVSGSSGIQQQVHSRTRNEPWDENIKVGQIVHTDCGVVEFVAKQGRKTVGQKYFEYEAKTAPVVKVEEED